MVLAMPAVPMEQVHERTSQQQEVCPGTCEVRPVLPQQEEQDDQRDHDGGTPHCTMRESTRFGLR